MTDRQPDQLNQTRPRLDRAPRPVPCGNLERPEMTPRLIDTVPTLPPRPRDSNKGLFGSVLIVAGSRGMAGAAALCGGAALRSGAGLVRVATPSEVQPTVASFEPSYMAYPLPCDDDGLIRFDSAKPIIERLQKTASVVAVGPGLGQSDDIRRLVMFLIASCTTPLVIDADGLNALVGHTEVLSNLTHPVILTPHPGEFARLTGASIADVQADRVARATRLASLSESLVVVLKGAGTVVTDGHQYYINTSGNPGMATGGTGDVLTGVLAALLAQKMTPFQAAQLGVFIHGLAGDVARDQNGEIGLIAGDLVDALPDAFVHAMPDQDLVTLG
jgi:ADP-dependent NAD(P)H-hydrate dehydratase